MSKCGLVVKCYIFFALFICGLLCFPCLAQQPQTLPEIEANLRNIQKQINSQESVLKDFISLYTALDVRGAQRGNRPMYSADVNLSYDWVRYSAARLLTLPHPYDYSSFMSPEAPFAPPLSLGGGASRITQFYEAKKAYDSLANRIPVILAEIQRLDKQRQELEAERTYLSGETRPLTQGAVTDSRIDPEKVNADALVAEGNRLLTKEDLPESNRQLNHEDLQEAKSKFEEALRIEPSHSEAFLGRGIVFFLFVEQQSAASDFDQAIALDKDNGEAYYWRGRLREEMFDLYDKAAKDYQIGCDLKFSPACHAMRNIAINRDKMGVEAHGREDYEAAIRLFSEAIAFDPRYPDSWYDRGRIWEINCNHARAIEDYSNFIRHHENAKAYAEARPIPMPVPDEVGITDAFFRIGMAHLNMGTYDKALINMTKAAERAKVHIPDRVASYIYMQGMVYKEMGNLNRAAMEYERACTMGYHPACKEKDKIKK